MEEPNGTTGGPPGIGPASEAAPNLRPVLRAGCAFVLRVIANITKLAGGDLRSGLVFLALWTANMRPIMQSAANDTYGGMDTLPPDEMIRPIAVHALSESLLIPYETTRRHVEKLVAKGLCVRDGRGVRVAVATVAGNPEVAAMIANALPSLLLFLDDLRRSAFDFAPYRQPLPVTAPLPPSGELPPNARALLRVCSDYVARCVDVLGRLYDNDFAAGLVHTAIWMANVDGIRRGPENLTYGALHVLPPDGLRQPISISALAAGLAMPFETARRHVNKLLRARMAVRTGKGLVVPRAVLEQPRVIESARAVHAHSVRLVAELYRAGFDFSGY